MITLRRRTAVFGLAAALCAAPQISPAQPRPMARPGGWTTPPADGRGVAYRTFESAAANATVSFHLYLPPQYELEPSRRFPVLYWLHGSGPAIAGVSALAQRFDRAMRSGDAPAMIVVFPNGRGVSMWIDAHDGSSPVETVVVRELIPFVDGSFRTVAVRHGRMIEGFSMGGYGAARLGFTHRDVFSAVSMLGAGPLDPDFVPVPANAALRDHVLATIYGGDLERFRSVSPWRIAQREAAALRDMPLRLAIGVLDRTLPANRAFHEHLTGLDIPHEYVEVSGVRHEAAGLIDALGDRMWDFHHRVFGAL